MAHSINPGVATGDDYRTLIKAAKNGGYALPAVNVVGTNSVNAAMEAAANNRSDIIIQFSNSGGQFYGGYGIKDSLEAKILGTVSAAQHVNLLAQKYGICVVLHTDHANKGLIPWVEGLITHSETNFKKTGKPLFSSHMLDLSAEDIDFNLSESKRILGKLVPLGMSLEIELGVTGGEEDGVGSDDDIGLDNPLLYTQPEDCLKAWELLSPVGHFSLAASFGNVHGVYKPGNVKLRPEILKNSQSLIEKKCSTNSLPLDLVFHGGSGSDKQQISEAISYGVFKMNIDTDTQFAFAKEIGKYVTDNPKAFLYQIDPENDTPYKKYYDPRKFLRSAELSMVQRLDEAFSDLGSSGKTIAR